MGIFGNCIGDEGNICSHLSSVSVLSMLFSLYLSCSILSICIYHVLSYLSVSILSICFYAVISYLSVSLLFILSICIYPIYLYLFVSILSMLYLCCSFNDCDMIVYCFVRGEQAMMLHWGNVLLEMFHYYYYIVIYYTSLRFFCS